MTAEALWKEFCETTGTPEETAHQAWAFGGAPDLLARLVLAGRKTATASAYDWYLNDPTEPMPAPGDYSVLLDACDNAVAVIRTVKTYVVPFDEVSEEHARKEGEGDLSLEYWRRVHEDFFMKDFSDSGMIFHQKIPILAEEFELCYTVPDNDEVRQEDLIDLFCIRDVAADMSYRMAAIDRITLRTYDVLYRVRTSNCCGTDYTAECTQIPYSDIGKLLKDAPEDIAMKKLKNSGLYQTVAELNNDNVHLLLRLMQ